VERTLKRNRLSDYCIGANKFESPTKHNRVGTVRQTRIQASKRIIGKHCRGQERTDQVIKILKFCFESNAKTRDD